MKKSTIWLLTVIMALTFAGLLYMQIMYMENMIKMRDDQFAESVKRSLYSVTQMLVKDETSHYFDKEIDKLQVGTTYAEYAGTPPQVDGVTLRFTTKSGIETDLSIKGDAENIVRLQSPTNGVLDHYKSMQEVLKGQYLYHKGLTDQLILSIITQSSNRPIEERADSTTVRRYLKNEFENNGIDLPFEFAIVNKSGRNVYTTAGFTSLLRGDNNMFVQTLFPNDPAPRINYLKVYFPDKHKFLLSSIKLIIPTFIFTFILFCTFVYTIVIAFRQKKLTEMKNDFINNLTHEFKTPISSISLAAQMLNDDTVRKSPTMLQHISTVIMDETKRLRFQVEKVLQMSMFDRHKSSLRLQDVDANQAIENITKTFKLKVERYGGNLTASLNATDSTIMVDEMHFTNVIFNLLDNAVKYRQEDRPLQLNVTTRDISGNRLEIVVSDNGIGIKKEDIKRIFEKFYRVSTGNRHDVKGFGLGLAYVEKMIQAFKGEIKVESEFNQGTKFIITLPITKN